MTVKEARKRRKLTQTALALQVKTQQSTISKIERREVNPADMTWGLVHGISSALGYRPETLFPVEAGK
jgi:transcriptional regulator with XRE-family HTH domain